MILETTNLVDCFISGGNVDSIIIGAGFALDTREVDFLADDGRLPADEERDFGAAI